MNISDRRMPHHLLFIARGSPLVVGFIIPPTCARSWHRSGRGTMLQAKARLKALVAAEALDTAALTAAIDEARLAGVAPLLLRAAASRLREHAPSTHPSTHGHSSEQVLWTEDALSPQPSAARDADGGDGASLPAGAVFPTSGATVSTPGRSSKPCRFQVGDRVEVKISRDSEPKTQPKPKLPSPSPLALTLTLTLAFTLALTECRSR